jgi:hypothetical protein
MTDSVYLEADDLGRAFKLFAASGEPSTAGSATALNGSTSETASPTRST